jgi:hypothetical protein
MRLGLLNPRRQKNWTKKCVYFTSSWQRKWYAYLLHLRPNSASLKRSTIDSPASLPSALWKNSDTYRHQHTFKASRRHPAGENIESDCELHLSHLCDSTLSNDKYNKAIFAYLNDEFYWVKSSKKKILSWDTPVFEKLSRHRKV